MLAVAPGPGAPASISSQLAISAKAIATSTAANQSQWGVHKYSLEGQGTAKRHSFDTAPTPPISDIQITAVPYGRGNWLSDLKGA